MIIDLFFRGEFPVPTVLNNATTFFLSPVHHLAGKRIIIIKADAIYQTKPYSDEWSWGKTTLMIILSVPSLITGTVLRLLSLTDPKVRKCLFASVQPMPASSSIATPEHFHPRTPGSRVRFNVSPNSSVRRKLDFDTPDTKSPASTVSTPSSPDQDEEITITYEELKKMEVFFGALLSQKRPGWKTWIESQKTADPGFYPFFYARWLEIHQRESEKDLNDLSPFLNLFRQCKIQLRRQNLLHFLAEKPPGFTGELTSPQD